MKHNHEYTPFMIGWASGDEVVQVCECGDYK